MKWIKKNGSENVRPVIHVRPAGLVRPEVSDRFRYVPEVYTPARLKRIMEAANSGDTQALCICGREILERSWDIMGAFEQRASALLGAGYDILPGGDSPLDKACAEAFEKALRKAGDGNTLGTFQDLLSHLLTGVILPFAAAEIVWSDGGNLAGFVPVGSHHFTMRNSFTPRLVTEDHPDGLPEEDPDAAEIAAGRRALAQKWRLLNRESDPRKKREKAFRFMAGRGFAPSLIFQLLNEIGSEENEEIF